MLLLCSCVWMLSDSTGRSLDTGVCVTDGEIEMVEDIQYAFGVGKTFLCVLKKSVLLIYLIKNTV